MRYWAVFIVFLLIAIPSKGDEVDDSLYQSAVREGMESLSIDSLSRAESLFRQAMHLVPTHHGNYLLFRYIGQIQERQGRRQEALESYSTGLNLSPRCTELMLDRAALQYRMGNDQRALMDYTDALEIQPQCMEALLMRAHIYSGMRDYKSARRDYDAMLAIDPLNEEAYIGLILLNDRDGRPQEAMEQINALIAVYPSHGVLYAIRGGIEHRRKLYERALADLTKAITLEPRNPDFYVSRATLYLDMNKWKLARQDTQMAVSLGADPKEMASILKK